MMNRTCSRYVSSRGAPRSWKYSNVQCSSEVPCSQCSSETPVAVFVLVLLGRMVFAGAWVVPALQSSRAVGSAAVVDCAGGHTGTGHEQNENILDLFYILRCRRERRELGQDCVLAQRDEE
jgi:hypothetical protein